MNLQSVLSGAAGGVVVYVLKALFDHALTQRRERSAQQHRRALQQEDFRLKLADKRDRVHSVAGLANHLEFALRFEQAF